MPDTDIRRPLGACTSSLEGLHAFACSRSVRLGDMKHQCVKPDVALEAGRNLLDVP